MIASPALRRTATDPIRRSGVIDPSYDYAGGGHRHRSLRDTKHHDVGPELRSHERGYRRSAARGEFPYTTDELGRVIPLAEAGGVPSPSAARAVSLDRRDTTTNNNNGYSAYRRSWYADRAYSQYLEDWNARHGTRTTSTTTAAAAPVSGRESSVITTRVRPVTFTPARTGGGTLAAGTPIDQAVTPDRSIHLNRKQSIPYTSGLAHAAPGAVPVPATPVSVVHDASAIAGPAPRRPHPVASPPARLPATAVATGSVVSPTRGTTSGISSQRYIAPRGRQAPVAGRAEPVTTVNAVDRANQLMLEETEASRPRSTTKIGWVTIEHDPARAMRLQREMEAKSRARVLGPIGRTTTEVAVLRADAIAADEARRDRSGRRAMTKIGPWLTY
ncbi:hypothetical protein BC828DRAFT_110842 [Blastocladiella britannica]|nr:hypothetical protein BC828DRAFT_110842 [Blastocladiella britannica]